MKSFRLLAVLFCCSVITLSVNSQVKVWEEPMTIPTWEIGPAEVNPTFSWSSSKDPIYPYPYQEILTNNKGEKTYKACWLENEFIKVLVLPEIGGRLHGAQDKTNGYNFLYWQPTIKPGLIGMAGAWISGGIEWNFPHGHRPTCYNPVSYKLVENDDGSKTIWVGETEWVYRMRWIIGLTLYPGKSVIEAKTRLLNPTSLRHPFFMWATGAVHANEDYQAIIPTRMVTGHGKFYFLKWPVHKGVDISWWKNNPNATSFFSMELGEFFGGYDYGKQAGTIFTGNKYIVIGKKVWTWGNSPFGRNWEPILTEGGGPYYEPQAGAYSDNQPDYHWLEPGEVKSFSYFFYPVRDIGAFKQANVHGALNLEFNGDTVRIGVYSTSILNPGIIRLTQNGKIVFERQENINPSRPFNQDLKISDASKNQEWFSLCLLDKEGTELVSYSPEILEELPIPEPTKVFDKPGNIKTNDELWQAGEITCKFRDPMKGRTYFEEAIARDSGDSRSRISLAELDIKRASYKTALEHLTIAEERDPDNGKIFYLRAVVEEALGDYKSAYDHFYRSVHFQAYLSRAYERIAMLDLRNGDYINAVNHIEKAIESNVLNPQLWVLKATALRLKGELKQAEETADHALELDPVHPQAINEKMLTLKAQGKSYDSERKTLKQILLGDYQYDTDLVIQYINCGLFESALEVLKLAKENSNQGLALLDYYEGYLKSLMGKKKETVRSFKSGMKQSIDSIFPFRIEEIEIFRSALKCNPKDSNAHYYLGLVYAAIAEVDSAVAHWKRVVELDPENVRAWRDLGLSFFKTGRDLNKTKRYYETAFNLAPDDSRILKELDEVKEALKESYEQRLAFLREHKDIVEKRDELLTRMIYIMGQTGHYEEALEYYLNHQFHNWEGRYSIHNDYMTACIGMAKRAETPEQALQWYQKACEYPRNLEFAPRAPNLRGFLYYPMSQLYKEINDAQEADRLLQITVKESTSIPTLANYYQAMALRDVGQSNNAEEIMNGFKEEAEQLVNGKIEGYLGRWRSKSKAMGHYYRSKILETEGKLQEAEQEFKKAAAIDSYIERNALIFAQIMFAETHQ